MKDILQEKFEQVAGGPITDRKWDCDLKYSIRDVIIKQNILYEKDAGSIEEKFNNLPENPESLRNILISDCKYLSRSKTFEKFQNIVEFVDFLEIYNSKPECKAFSQFGFNSVKHYISFSTPFLYYLYSFFSKSYILMHDSTYADCHPDYDRDLSSDVYSDEALYAGVFNDFEVFFHQNTIEKPVTPKHLAYPYDYIEMSEGARRFILAHEIGHLVLKPSVAKLDAEIFNCQEIEETIVNALGEKRASAWMNELCCDDFAMLTILSLYDEPLGFGPKFYELENTFKGILLFFSMLEFVELCLGTNPADNTHPPASIRSERARYWMKTSPVYRSSGQLREVLFNYWKRVNSLRRFLSGTMFSDVSQALNANQRLNAIGREAQKNLYRDELTRTQRRNWAPINVEF